MTAARFVATILPRLGLALPGLALAGCQNDSTAPAEYRYVLVLERSSLFIQPGQTDTTTLTLTRLGGFTGQVTVSAVRAPGGVRITLRPKPGLADAYDVTVVVARDVPFGSHDIRISGRASGGAESFAKLQLMVSPLTYTLVLERDSIAVLPGTHATTSLTVARDPGFTPQVTLSASGVPTGVSITFDRRPSTLDLRAVSIAIAAGVPSGSHAITITGQSPGSAERSTTLRLVVSPSHYTFYLLPDSLFIQPGTESVTTLAVRRDPGFTGEVTFSASGTPTGVRITFGSRPGSDAYTVTVAAATSLVPASHAIAITGKTADRADRTATVTLIVKETVTGGNTSVFFCSQRPILFAFQDGDSGWIPVAGESGRYRFDITSGRGAFAFVLEWRYVGGQVAYETHVYYGTQAELASVSPACVIQSRGSVAGSTSNGGEDVKIALPDSQSRLGLATNFFLASLNEPVDLVAWSSALVGQLTNKVIIRRDQRLVAGTTLPVLDFNTAEAITPVARGLNFPAEVEYVVLDYYTANGTLASLMCYSFLYNFEFCSVSSHDAYPGIPSPQNGDMHRLSLWAGNRSVTSCFREAVDQTLVLPPSLGPIDVSKVASPTPRFRTRYTRQPEYNGGIHVRYTSGNPVTRELQLHVSAAYLGTSSVVDLTSPDFSVLSGWNASWGLDNASALLTFEARGWTDMQLTDPNAVACRGDGTAFDRMRPQSSRIQFAWTSPMVVSAAH